MKKEKNCNEVTKTLRFELIGTQDISDGFFVDIVYDVEEQLYGYWLYHEEYGVKDYCIGLPKFHNENGHKVEVIRSVDVAEVFLYESAFQEYKTEYREEHMPE